MNTEQTSKNIFKYTCVVSSNLELFPLRFLSVRKSVFASGILNWKVSTFFYFMLCRERNTICRRKVFKYWYVLFSIWEEARELLFFAWKVDIPKSNVVIFYMYRTADPFILVSTLCLYLWFNSDLLW